MDAGRGRRVATWIGAAVVAVAAGGCSAVVTSTTVPHALSYTGPLGPTRAAHAEARRADELGVPHDALGLEAELVALSESQACFDVTARLEAQRPRADAELRLWYFALRGEPAVRAHTPALTTEPETREQAYRAEPQLESRRHEPLCGSPVLGPCPTVHVLETTQRVCFAHDGTINPQTRRLTLAVTPPDRDPDTRRVFEWVFDPRDAH